MEQKRRAPEEKATVSKQKHGKEECLADTYHSIYQKLSQVMREIAGTCTPSLSLCKCVFFPLSIDVSPLLGKHLQLLPHSWSAFSPTLLLPPAWSLLGGNVAYNGPKVNHLQVSPDKSQCVCCAPSKSQQQLCSKGYPQGGLWHSERWPRWEAMCWEALSEHHHLECLHCPEGTCLSLQWTQLRDAKKRAKFSGWLNGLTSEVEFAHNLGLMCDVLSELKGLAKHSERKRRKKKSGGKGGGGRGIRSVEKVDEKKEKGD